MAGGGEVTEQDTLTPLYSSLLLHLVGQRAARSCIFLTILSNLWYNKDRLGEDIGKGSEMTAINAAINAAIAQLAKSVYTGDDQVDVAEAIKVGVDKLWPDAVTVDQIAKWLENSRVFPSDDIYSLTDEFIKDRIGFYVK